MELTENQQPNAFILTPRGRLDSNTAPAFEPQLLSSIAAHRCLVLSLAEMPYISSAGLRVLLVAAKKAKQQQHRFMLCDMSQPVREVFEISGFLSILEIHDTCAQCLAAVTD